MTFLIYACKRLLMAVPMLWLVLTVSFFLVRAAPGSPLDRDSELPAELKKNLARQYGLDRPLLEQYVTFIQRASVGDFGNSYTWRNRSVSTIIQEAFPISARIGIFAMLFALTAGLGLGMIAAVRQNTWIDHLLMTSVVLGKSVPPMVLAPLFVAIFSVSLGLLPVAGWESGSFLYVIGPVLCLGLYDIAAIARLSRGSVLDVMRQKYIMTARAKGLGESRIMVVHVLREALMPLVTYLAPALSSILIGTVIVEQVFNIPGLGRYLVSGAINRDYTLVLGIATLASALVIGMNLLADIILGLLDPRIRLQA